MTITTFSFTTYGTITTWTVPFYTAGTMSAKVAGGEGGGISYTDGGVAGVGVWSSALTTAQHLALASAAGLA